MTNWQKSDWRKKPRVQMPDYLDESALNSVESRLASYPPPSRVPHRQKPQMAWNCPATVVISLTDLILRQRRAFPIPRVWNRPIFRRRQR